MRATPRNWIDKIIAGHFRGAQRLRKLLRRGAPTTLIVFEVDDGLRFALNPESYIDGAVISDGFYEPEVLQAIVEHVPENGVFWDVGANIGLHSIAAKKKRPDITVYAFEPDPVMAARLLLNRTLNGLSCPRLMSLALSDKFGLSDFHIASAASSGLSSLTPLDGASFDSILSVLTVPAFTLTSEFGVKMPNFVKLDVEGSEANVLTGLFAAGTPPELKGLVFEAHTKEIVDQISGMLGSEFKVVVLAPTLTSEPTNFLALRQQQ